MPTFCMQPVGFVRSPRTEPIGDDSGTVLSHVELDAARFGDDSLRGLSEFSHVEIVYWFDRVDSRSFELGARRPRNNPDWPEVEVFAQRNKRRPNRIGIGTCELLEIDGLDLTVRRLDAIDGPCLTSSRTWWSSRPEDPSASQPGRTS
jgi:tRNA (Thr-GGU) A37 N-methylase